MTKHPKIHFIGLEGSTMSHLAINLQKSGHLVSASLGEISQQDATLLQQHGITGTNNEPQPSSIDDSVQLVILGPACKANNPEIARAQSFHIPVLSLSEFIYRESIDKQRLVVAGTYGKSMIAAIILHVLNFHKRKFDYLVSSPVAGLNGLVRLTNAPLIIIEGKEIPDSTLDPMPAFLKYRHHIGVISGIEWQQSSIYPTKEAYTLQFEHFVNSTPKSGTVIYFEFNPVVAALSKLNPVDVQMIPYKTPSSIVENGQEFLITSDKEKIPLKIMGKHSLQNLAAAQEALKKLGITNELFYQAVPSFTVGQ